jgi:ornithine carbamoyltransferase
MKRDFISISDFSKEELNEIFSLTTLMKKQQAGLKPLLDKTVALIFEKPSPRTCVSFEVAVKQLGGHPIFLTQDNIGITTRESVQDMAQILSRYNDLIIARTMRHETIEKLAKYASIPVINALSDVSHPCQILADVYTLIEKKRFDEKTKIVFIGDGNNVVNSWLELAEKIPFHFVLVCPKGYEPDKTILIRALNAGVSQIELVHDPSKASENAEVLYTDVWVSMGQEQEAAERKKIFKDYQINEKLLQRAKPDCLVMHCLPAHRGEEITEDVLEGKHSIIIEEAENRLHAQKGIIAFLFGECVNKNHHIKIKRKQVYETI